MGCGALVAAAAAASGRVAWWVPVHLALAGAASQAIVGGQLMFSVSLGMAPGPGRAGALAQLGALNAAALLVVAGRLWGRPGLLGVGASLFAVVAGLDSGRSTSSGAAPPTGGSGRRPPSTAWPA